MAVKKVVPWQIRFPDHSSRICALLTGYGELEFLTYCAVSAAQQEDDVSFRVLFRLRNESQRIDIADAILFPSAEKNNIAGQYGHVIGALRHCRNIRNTYAHCHWQTPDGRLSYCDLQETAKTQSNTRLQFVSAELDFLDEQLSYFTYCSDGLLWLRQVFEHKNSAGPSPTIAAPQARSKPILGSPAS